MLQRWILQTKGLVLLHPNITTLFSAFCFTICGSRAERQSIGVRRPKVEILDLSFAPISWPKSQMRSSRVLNSQVQTSDCLDPLNPNPASAPISVYTCMNSGVG